MAALIGAALATALTMPAAAERRNVMVQMADGSVQAFVLDVAPGATLQDMSSLVPGEPVGYEVLDEPEPEPEPEPVPVEPAP